MSPYLVGFQREGPELIDPARVSDSNTVEILEGVDRDTRREENQKMFRQGNEMLHDAAVGAGETSLVPFLCECADDDCLGRVQVTTGQWESVAKARNHYLMIAGHPRSEGEEIVGSVAEYEIARKPD